VDTLLEVRNLRVVYYSMRGLVKAVDNVSLGIEKGSVMGVVGESGSGKTTLALSILRILPPNARIVSGSILYRGEDIAHLPENRVKDIRWRRISIVPQAALNALNPTMKIKDHFIETGRAHGMSSRDEILERASKLLEMMRLEPGRVLESYPHELSGGMKQRVLIALALLLDPELVIFDEPTTALDVLTQRAILDLLKDLHRELGLTMMFITHDIATVADLADRVAVMYAGKLVEVGDVYTIFKNPYHPYTRALIRSIPSLVGRVEDMKPIPGSPPDLINPPPGCRFHPRCEKTMPRCMREEPPLIEIKPGHVVSCWLYARG